MNIKNKDEGSAEWDQIEIGDQVRHPKWGVGTVLFRSGMGNSAKAIVVFPEEGQKKLMLRFAKVKKVGTTSLKSVEKLKAESLPKAIPLASVPLDDDEDVPLDLEEGAEDVDLLLEEDADVAGFGGDEEDEFTPPAKGDDES